ATHFDGHHRARLQFKKRYDDLCQEWLGGLTVLSRRSKIIAEQLGRHLDQLVALGFLASYQLQPAANAEECGITFRPGHALFDDYQRFYVRRAASDIRVEASADELEIGEPHRVAYLFIEKRTGQQPAQVPYVSTRDVEAARELLARVPLVEMPA